MQLIYQLLSFVPCYVKKKLNLKALELTYFFTPLKFRRDIAQEYMKLNRQELKLCTRS